MRLVGVSILVPIIVFLWHHWQASKSLSWLAFEVFLCLCFRVTRRFMLKMQRELNTGEEDSSTFLKFSKTLTFSRKSIYTKLRAFGWLCFSPETTKKKQYEKNCLCFKQACNYRGQASLNFFRPPGNWVGHGLKHLGPSQKTLHPPWCPKLVTGLAS